MRELSLREIQLVEFNLLKIFDKICKKHHLNYSLSFGTLIGAVRHKGFIPWDDDLDVCMPRDDYEKFLNLDLSHEVPDYVKRIRKNDGDYIFPFTKLIDTRFHLETIYMDESADKFLWMDIFPVDGLPNTKFGFIILYSSIAFFRRIESLCNAKLGVGTTEFKRRAKKYLQPVAKLIGVRRCVKMIEYISQIYPLESAEYAGIVTGVWYIPKWEKWKLKKVDFLMTETAVFEGQEFPVIAGWDKFLTAVYGNYLEFPPEEYRRGHILKAEYMGDDEPVFN